MRCFSVMSKQRAHSIQSCPLHVIVKSQGQATSRTGATSDFQRLVKMRNYFCGLAVCAESTNDINNIMKNRPDCQVVSKASLAYINVTDSEPTKVIFHFEQPLKIACLQLKFWQLSILEILQLHRGMNLKRMSYFSAHNSKACHCSFKQYFRLFRAN